MKYGKIILVCIAILLIISTFAGCAASKEVDFEESSVTIGENSSDYEGVEIEIVNAHYEEGLKLDIKWSNNTEHLVTYGEWFVIEKETDGQWIRCQANKMDFPEIAYVLVSDSHATRTYDISEYYKISQAGKYRLCTECYIQQGDEKSTPCILSAEFELELV
ncbi:MAG: hypothetical protein E7385_08185 [Ruminococcaceae bacterium]|nr:hypothetical protein [Oscillospiraceae bacterium]